MRFVLLATLLVVFASCATARPECSPKMSKVCDPTQVEHWEEEIRVALAELGEEGVDDAEEH